MGADADDAWMVRCSEASGDHASSGAHPNGLVARAAARDDVRSTTTHNGVSIIG